MRNRRKTLSCITLFLCVMLGCILFTSPAYAAAGTLNESEPNNTYSTADVTYDNYDNYGYISTSSDVDWWKVSFSYGGTANFWLGNIPSSCDYDLRLYSSNGTTLLASSLNSGNANELITCTVSANTTYYVKITSHVGTSATNQYLFRAKIYPSRTIAGVPLYEQETTSTCGCASGRMMLASYGINVSESTFKSRATILAGQYADYTYVYVIKDTLNYFLSDDGNNVRYKYTYVGSYTTAEYQDLVLTNILNNHPVQPNIKVSSTDYFPYTTNGHYVVIKGMRYNTGTATYNTIVNDPHYNYCGTYTVPLSVMLNYTHAHGSGGYLIHVDD